MNPPRTRAIGSTEPKRIAAEMTLDEELDQWLQRLNATHAAVSYTCTSRLGGDRAVAEQVALQVMAGLLSKPSVFRYFGLPYSGRIARLAENLIGQANAGTLVDVPWTWSDLYALLERLAPPHRDVLVLTCVRGVDVAELAEHLGSSREFATHRYNAMLTHMRRLAASGMSPGTDPDAITEE